jgi:hypothetical protein
MRIFKNGLPDFQPYIKQGFAHRKYNTGTGIIYYCFAVTGAATSAAVWRIMKIDDISPNRIITWADGNDLFDNICDNYLSLSYI